MRGRIQGTPALIQFMRNLPEAYRKSVFFDAMEEGGKLMQKKVQSKLTQTGQIDSGKLRAGIETKTEADPGKIITYVYASGVHNYVALFLEYGVKKHGLRKGARRKKNKLQIRPMHPGYAAHPFMRPALDENAKAFMRAVAKSIQKRLSGLPGNLGSQRIRTEVLP